MQGYAIGEGRDYAILARTISSGQKENGRKGTRRY